MTAAVQRRPLPRLDQLVRDIEAAITSRDRAQQSALVMRSADALVRRWSRLPVADKPAFDRLLASLLKQVDEEARAVFADRLTPLRRAPGVTTALLAGDPSFRVARPLLERCPSFDEMQLLDIVAACGEAHRCAIARRPALNAALCRALVRTGSAAVIGVLVGNPGAAVPADALPDLMEAATGSEALALALGARDDLQALDRAHLVDLAHRRARASLARDGIPEGEIASLLTRVARTFATPVAPERLARFAGTAAVADEAFGPGPVSPAWFEIWLQMHRIEDVLAALARDACAPIAVLVASFDAPDPAALTAVVKGLDLPWTVLKALLQVRHGGLPEPDLLTEVHRIHGTLSALSGRRLARDAAVRLGVRAFPLATTERASLRERAALPDVRSADAVVAGQVGS